MATINSNNMERNLKERIKDILNDDNDIYDMYAAFSDDEIVEIVSSLIEEKNRRSFEGGKIITGVEATITYGDYDFTICNKRGGWVQCYDTVMNKYGTSTTMFIPYYYDPSDPDDGLRNLIEMVNEAWYRCHKCSA